MIDLHCHILPGMDDGAAMMDDALEMAHMAALSGVRTVVATPHCNRPGNPDDNFAGQELTDRLQGLRSALQEAQIPLCILPGAEVFCTPRMAQLLEDGKLLTLANSKYMLMEFYFDESPEFMEDCFGRVLRRGKVPVVAHPERYEAVFRNPELVARWFRKGLVIQLNKGSILGRLGSHAEAVSKYLLEQGLAHVVASDAHSSRVRTPHMAQVAHHLEQHYAPEYARILLSRNPERIIQDRSVIKP